ncbi:MAG: DnaJ domain-containing protein [Bacteroidales bacterium]|nr:DnaJ domain-containing protein [Bacteroidales bacterium]
MKNYYKILKVTRDSSAVDIRHRFKELALEYHPDVSIHEKAQDYFVEINEAFQILGDPDKKAAYDKLYDAYYTKAAADLLNKENAEKDFRTFASHARSEAQHRAKIRYEEYIRNADCFFTAGPKANGVPFSYNMHRTTGITGGIGPMGSIKAKAITIPIPRSKKAMLIHRIGFGIKAFFFILLLLMLRFDLFTSSSFVLQAVVSLFLIGMGGIITRMVYKMTGVKAKIWQAKKYFLVMKYRSKGYERGFHPMVSTTPVGIIIAMGRWIF